MKRDEHDVFEFQNIKLEHLVGTNLFRVLEDYVTPEVTVPKGFVTNGASSGRLLQSLYPSYDKYLPAALVHDYMYSTGDFSREYTDKLFKYNIGARLGLSWRYHTLMFMGVRVGGGFHYRKKK